jgi:GTP pyrophosphokinase
LVEVAWHGAKDGARPVDILVQAEARQGVLEDITRFLAQKDIPIIGINRLGNRTAAPTHMRLTIEVSDTKQLSGLLNRLAQVPGILEVHRSEPGK